MSNVRGVAVASDVGGPFEAGYVRVAGADVARLELFELLGCAQFVGLRGGLVRGGLGAEGRMVPFWWEGWGWEGAIMWLGKAMMKMVSWVTEERCLSVYNPTNRGATLNTM